MNKFLNGISLLSLLIFSLSVHAQREFYSTSVYSTGPGTSAQEGKLVKLDSTGMLPTLLHPFDMAMGKYPYGSVIQATNGKLYGLTREGGVANNGVLYQYDLSIDSFTVKQQLGDSVVISNGGAFGLFEASDGKLYYVSGTKYFMEYDIPSNTLTQRHYFNSPQIPAGHLTEINGKLYGVINFGGPMGYRGYISEYNTANEVLTYKYNFQNSLGIGPTERPVYYPANGLLYGTVRYAPGASPLGDSEGSIYSFNPATNAYSYKLNIPDSIGYSAYLIVAPNQKIYGLSEQGGTDAQGNHFGGIFEYTPTTNSIRMVHNFGMQADGSFTGSGHTVGGMILASDGMLYGTTASHAFRFNYLTDSVTRLADLSLSFSTVGAWFNVNGFLQEVCRKPSYTYFDTLSVTLCAGDTYNYTVHSGNAETYTWKRNGNALASQTDSILSFNSISVSDSGTYTCSMTNMCGATETIGAIRIAVNTGPAGAPVLSATGPTEVCEGETVEITGNTGGTWNVGGTGASLSTDTSGTYFVVSGSGSCGTDTSNHITVTVNPVPVINGQPADISIPEGTPVTFHVVPQGTGHTYQWQVNQNSGAGFVNLTNTAPYSGVNTATLGISNPVLPMDGYLYRCVVSSGACADTSQDAELLVTEPSDIADWATADEVSVFPNPATDVLYFRLKEGTILQSLGIRNMLGQDALRQTGNVSFIDITTLPKGVYTLELVTEQGHYVARFVKN